MPRKPTLKEAKAWAIRVYTLALAKAARGDWEAANQLTLAPVGCAFCRIYGGELACADTGCIVSHLCNAGWRGRTRAVNENAYRVLNKVRTPAKGIRHFKRTIEQLEALEV